MLRFLVFADQTPPSMSPFSSCSPGVPRGFEVPSDRLDLYDLFTEAANHLVTGSALLAEMLSADVDHEYVAKQMREAEHAADETTHAIIRRVNSTFVTPFDREDIYALASGLDDVMDMMDEVVDLILLYEVKVLPGALGPGGGHPALRRHHGGRDARSQVDAGPRRVLDRDQPSRERR